MVSSLRTRGRSVEPTFGDQTIRVIRRDDLLEYKRAAGCHQDLLELALLD